MISDRGSVIREEGSGPGQALSLRFDPNHGDLLPLAVQQTAGAFCLIQGVRRSWKSWIRGSPDLSLTCLQHWQPPRGALCLSPCP